MKLRSLPAIVAGNFGEANGIKKTRFQTHRCRESSAERRRGDVTVKIYGVLFFFFFFFFLLFTLPRGIVSTGKVVYIYPRGKMTFIGEAESHQAHNIAAYRVRSKRSAIDARTIRFGPERYNR